MHASVSSTTTAASGYSHLPLRVPPLRASAFLTPAHTVLRVASLAETAMSSKLTSEEGSQIHTLLQGSLAETVAISNLGVAKTGPVVEESGSLLLEYVNGSACTTSDGRLTTYSTRIHLVCGRGTMVSAAQEWRTSTEASVYSSIPCFKLQHGIQRLKLVILGIAKL